MTRAHVRTEIRYAWRGPSLLIVHPDGTCGGGLPGTGFFFREARYLRTLRLEINGEQPWLCETAIESPARLSFTFIYPELSTFGGGGSGQSGDAAKLDDNGIPDRSLNIEVRYQVHLDALTAHLSITNRTRKMLAFDVRITMDADFIDFIYAGHAEPPGVADVDARADGMRLDLAARQEMSGYAARIVATGGTWWRASNDGVSARLQLGQGEADELLLRIEPQDPTGAADAGVEERERFWGEWHDQMTRIAMPSSAWAEGVVRQSVEDVASFAMLEGAPDEWLTMQAGVPLYPALFGRDALTAGWQCALLDRGRALDATLTRLGRLQGTHDDPERDEELGRIVQQVRLGPASRHNEVPFGQYYGDFASPFMFVIALAHLYAWTGERRCLERHWDVARRILDWARERGDRDGDGYLEYLTHSPSGATNQGWKDSGDAVVYEDGTPARAPIATCELQGYWFAAQQLMAVMSWVMGERADATAYWQSASSLKKRFNRDWWSEDDGFVALAMDADKRLVAAPGTNAGHCVAAGIVSDEYLPRVVGRLFAPDLFSGWGIRTLSTLHPSYDPLSYHRGSVWAVENATIAFGLRRFGFDTRALELTRALFDLASLYPDARIPETVGGHARGDRPAPGAYPRANTPQLWNASAMPLLVHTLAGLQPVAALDLLVVDPALPDWMPELILHDLRLGGATLTLRLWRDDSGDSHAEIVRRKGTVHLVRQPPLESLSAGWRDRFTALADRLLHH